jgi:exonuclease SbcD
VLTGTLDELLDDPAHAAAEEAFVSARLTDAVRPADPMRRLRTRFRHCVHLEWSGGGSDDGRSYQERLRGRGDLDVAGEFVSHVRGGVGATAAERDLLGRALRAAAREELTR